MTSKVEKFLQAAFAGESQTNRRYLAFAAQADQEGYPQIARLFRAAAESETVHAHNYLRALKGIGKTRENLEEAGSVENQACRERIPEMIKAAEMEGNEEAETLFRYALESERIHARLFQKAMEAPGSPQEAPSYYVCPTCGHTIEKKPPRSCPVCGTGGRRYKRID